MYSGLYDVSATSGHNPVVAWLPHKTYLPIHVKRWLDRRGGISSFRTASLPPLAACVGDSTLTIPRVPSSTTR